MSMGQVVGVTGPQPAMEVPNPLLHLHRATSVMHNTLVTDYVMCTDPRLKPEVQGRCDFFLVFIFPNHNLTPECSLSAGHNASSPIVMLPGLVCKEPNWTGSLESDFSTKQQGFLWVRACVHIPDTHK